MELVMDRPRRISKNQSGFKARIAAWFDNKKLRKQLDGMQADHAIMCDQYQMLKKHVFQLEKKLAEINKANGKSENSKDMETPYSVAILLAKKGCERNEIIKECGLTDSEADLILALHNSTRLLTPTTSATN
jgi:hypothetical protein